MSPATATVAYLAANGAGFNDAKAKRYGRYLERKVGLGERVVAAEEIVAAARPKRSPIHECFTWDDHEAAEQFRLVEARRLVSHIVRVEPLPTGETAKVRAFLHVTSETGDRGYVAETVVWQSENLSQQVVTRAVAELRGWVRRYSVYTQLAGVATRIDEVLSDELGEQ